MRRFGMRNPDEELRRLERRARLGDEDARKLLIRARQRIQGCPHDDVAWQTESFDRYDETWVRHSLACPQCSKREVKDEHPTSESCHVCRVHPN